MSSAHLPWGIAEGGIWKSEPHTPIIFTKTLNKTTLGLVSAVLWHPQNLYFDNFLALKPPP